jgi:hypothetical protein
MRTHGRKYLEVAMRDLFRVQVSQTLEHLTHRDSGLLRTIASVTLHFALTINTSNLLTEMTFGDDFIKQFTAVSQLCCAPV